jgi:hypothetical protein
VRKSAVFAVKTDGFPTKSDEICRECFALSLPEKFGKLHILNINLRASIKETPIFEVVFLFFAIIECPAQSRRQAESQRSNPIVRQMGIITCKPNWQGEGGDSVLGTDFED